MRIKKILKESGRGAVAIGAFLSAIIVLYIIDVFDYGLGFLLLFLRFLCLVGIVYALFCVLVYRGKAVRLAKTGKIVIIAGCVLFLSSFIAVVTLIVVKGRRGDVEGINYIVVAGAGLDGTEPSPALKSRLDEAFRLLEANPDAACVLTGGQNTNEIIPEALAMKNYLVDKGISPDRLIMEDKSSSTAQNMANAAALLDGLDGAGPHEIVVVTSDYHMFRSMLLAEKYGMKPVASPVRTGLWQAHYYLREYFSLLLYFVGYSGGR